MAASIGEIGLRSIGTDLDLYGLDRSNMPAVRDQGREALDVVLGLWTSEDGRFEHEGTYYKVHAPEAQPVLERRLHYRPYQRPHPPIGVAAAVPRSDTIRPAGERGWIPMSSSNLLAPDLRAQWSMVEEGAAATARTGNRSQWRIARDMYVGETPESAREEARGMLGHPSDEHQWINRKDNGQMAALKVDRSMSDEDVTVDYMMDNIWLVGDPEECADKLRRLHTDVGGFGTLLTITQDPDDHTLMQKSMRLLIEEVRPRVQGLT